MRRATHLLVAALALVCTAASGFPLTSYISSDSAWRPPAEVVSGAQRTFEAYFAAIEMGDFAAAYALRSQKTRDQQTEADFTTQMSGLYQRAGGLEDRTITIVTYIREMPGGLPDPGLYVAFDYRMRRQNAVRACGYAVVHAWPDGRMDIPSESIAIMSKESEAIHRRQGGQAAVDQAWAALERGCPGESDLRQLVRDGKIPPS